MLIIRQKNVELSACIDVMVLSLLMDVEDVFWEVVNRHTLSNLILEILKRDKILGLGTICISVSCTPISGDRVPLSAVVYACEHVVRGNTCL